MAKGKGKAAKRAKPRNDMALSAPPMRKEVSVKRARNGFVISSHTNNGERLFVAKDQSEAKKIAIKLL